MPWIVIPTVVVLHAAVLLLLLKMNWLSIGPMFIQLVGFTILAFIISKKFFKRKTRSSSSLFSFRAIIITVSLLFCTMGSNFLLQLGQKHLFGRVWVSDASKEAYENRHGKTEEILGRQLTAGQSKVFSLLERLMYETIIVLSEEVIFRWIVMGALVLVLPSRWAIVLSSLIFAGMHLVYPIAISAPQFGLTRLLPTFAIGIFCGVTYLWYGLPASFLIHFGVNLIQLFAFGEYDFVVDWILWGSAFCAVFLLGPTLWFTRRRATPA